VSAPLYTLLTLQPIHFALQCQNFSRSSGTGADHSGAGRWTVPALTAADLTAADLTAAELIVAELTATELTADELTALTAEQSAIERNADGLSAVDLSAVERICDLNPAAELNPTELTTDKLTTAKQTTAKLSAVDDGCVGFVGLDGGGCDDVPSEAPAVRPPQSPILPLTTPVAQRTAHSTRSGNTTDRTVVAAMCGLAARATRRYGLSVRAGI
jgi:hypothetical protein